MNIKGILFDKDGTLVDFYTMWYDVSLKTSLEIAKKFGKKEKTGKMLSNAGIADGKILSEGAMAQGTYRDISKEFYKALELKNEDFENFETDVTKTFEKNLRKAVIKPTCTDIIKVMEMLKSKNIIIGLATADNYYGANMCLEKLGIKKYFDYIGTDDGITAPKPNSAMLIDFTSKFHINAEETAVVGDTETDMKFAKNFGALAIGVCCGVTEKSKLEKYADTVIENLEDLIKCIE